MQLAGVGDAASGVLMGGAAPVSGPFVFALASAAADGAGEVPASLGPTRPLEPPASKRSKTRPVVSHPANERASNDSATAFASARVGMARPGAAFGFVGQDFEGRLPRMCPLLRLVTLACFVAAAFIGCLSYSSPASDAGAGAQDPDATVAASDDGGATNLGTVTIARDAGTPISPLAFGQNYWDWVDWSANGVTGLTGTETLVGGIHLNVIRAGGNNNDTNSPQVFDTAQIDKFVAYCRTVGAEPILQVPLIANNVDGGAASAQAAADMVTYANGTKGYGIKYWEIGNEPDLYSTAYDAGTAPLTAVDYCTQFHTYAAAMRAANAAAADGGAPIQLLGPELSYKYVPGNDWLTPFLDACKSDVDVVTIHRYPFSGAQTSINGALQGAKAFQSTLTAVQAIVKAHARPNTPLGVTETNISYDYDHTKYTTASSVAAPGTFYAALWTADALGVGLQNNLWTLAFWNLAETSAASSVLGFIVADQGGPQYYAEQMVSANLSGSVLTPAGVPGGFSIYASYDPSKASTSVVVINKNTTSGSLTIAIDTFAPLSLDFPATSLSLVQVADGDAGSPHVVRYTADLATASMPPQTIQ